MIFTYSGKEIQILSGDIEAAVAEAMEGY